MVTIKHINSSITVTPMPSSYGLFSDATIPNCPATHCCLVRASKVLKGVSTPELTQQEYETAIQQQLANKDNWVDVEFNVTEQDKVNKRDSIRGYSDEDLQKYIKDNTQYDDENLDDDGNPIIIEQPTEEDAKNKLINKNMDMITMMQTPVSVPTLEECGNILLEEKEKQYATSLVEQLIQSGHLVTDLDRVEDGVELYADWKTQFEVTEVE